ncbi:hypothetical protein SADUNF_Sadunf02G0029300 [Salix dunnii]|uniref:HhH-GPD domain-containing protein n=1 Tax=Salix dunnii TaxID=1413687 RepID=A0A835N600_9ROSI|nr:hypothetical protein SADUNF_Sadunf02G0029300 [Salix dunnii]
MGEQTQIQPQPQPQPSQSESQPLPQIENQVYHRPLNDPTTTVITTTNTESTTIPPPITSPPAKIPSRPRKIRKLSPDAAVVTTVNDPNSTQTSITTTNEAPRTTATKTPRTKTSHHRAIVALAPRIMARSLTCEGELENAIRHLRNADPLLASLIDIYPPPTFDTFPTPFLALSRSILYQQLAFKAGTSIYTRFISLCGGEAGVLPEIVLALTPQQLRQIGVSGRKASYLHDLARKYQNGILSDSAIVNMDDKSLFTMLTMVNGIGSWSVHMFMIFSLHRPDVLPINDLQVRKGVQLLYNLPELPRPSQMDQLCEKWRPYRSVASWYLWRFNEVKGSPSSAVALATSGDISGLLIKWNRTIDLAAPHPEFPNHLWWDGPVLGDNDWNIRMRSYPSIQQSFERQLLLSIDDRHLTMSIEIVDEVSYVEGISCHMFHGQVKSFFCPKFPTPTLGVYTICNGAKEDYTKQSPKLCISEQSQAVARADFRVQSYTQSRGCLEAFEMSCTIVPVAETQRNEKDVKSGSVTKTTSGKLQRWAAKERLSRGKMSVIMGM